MPSGHYNKHIKNGHKIYERAAFRYHTDVPGSQFVNWSVTKLVWMIIVVAIVLGITFLS